MLTFAQEFHRFIENGKVCLSSERGVVGNSAEYRDTWAALHQFVLNCEMSNKSWQ